MEIVEQLAAHDGRIGVLETDVGVLKTRDAARADEMVAIATLAEQLRRESSERDDATGKMVASIQLIFDKRQTAQDAQLSKLVTGQNAQLAAQRLQLIGVALGVIAFAFCAYVMRWSYEASAAAAAMVWAAVKQAMGPRPPPGSGGDPPSGTAPVTPPLLRVNGAVPT